MAFQLSLVVRPSEVKAVKDELERCNLLDKQQKIRDVARGADEPLFKLLLTTLTFPKRGTPSEGEKFVKDHTSLDVSARVEAYAYCPVRGHPSAAPRQQTSNPFLLAVARAIGTLPSDFEETAAIDKAALYKLCPPSFIVYGPLLLLPSALETQLPWQSFLTFENVKPYKSAFFAKMASEMNVRCIAIAHPVQAANADESENVMRSPSQLREVHGDFGPELPPYPEYVPTQADFDQAFWTEVRQHGIVQTWAPRYTMFSQGNVTEKSRILSMRSVATANAMGPWTAVDLFAGIGYFALPYAKAGAAKVLGWDINPWSIEGLRRGARANGHSVRVVAAPPVDQHIAAGDERFLVFHESNVHANIRISRMRRDMPPVRHVNCGMLPTSAMAWKTAIAILDPTQGGWVHIHESTFESKINQHVANIHGLLQTELERLGLPMELMIRAFRRLGYQNMADDYQERMVNTRVILENVVVVKSMAPRLNHYVIDFHVPPFPNPIFAESTYGFDPPLDREFPYKLAHAIKDEKLADLKASLREQEERMKDASTEEVEEYLASLEALR